MFEDSFLRAINDGSEAALRSLLEEVHPGIYSFPMLKLSFCEYTPTICPHLGSPRNGAKSVMEPAVCLKSWTTWNKAGFL